jgi:hypothetical protein
MSNPSARKLLENLIQRKEPAMRTILRSLLAITTVVALFGITVAQVDYGDTDPTTLTMLEIAALHGWNQPEVVALTAQPDFDTLTMLEVAALHGWNQPQPVAFTDLPQFADATIEHLVDLVTFVANRYYDGDVIAACDGIYSAFESDAQMNYVIFVLTGS